MSCVENLADALGTEHSSTKQMWLDGTELSLVHHFTVDVASKAEVVSVLPGNHTYVEADVALTNGQTVSTYHFDNDWCIVQIVEGITVDMSTPDEAIAPTQHTSCFGFEYTNADDYAEAKTRLSPDESLRV